MKRENRRGWWTPARLTWALSVGALALSLWTAMAPRPATALVLGLTLVALIWYTRYTYESVQLTRRLDEENRVRRRRGMASAILAEMMLLEAVLQRIYDNGINQARVERLGQNPVLDEWLRSPEVFSAEVADRLIVLATGIRALRHEALHPPKLPARSGLLAQQYFKDRALEMRWLISSLADGLRAEGGTMPPETRPPGPAAPGGPNVPESPFKGCGLAEVGLN